MIQTLAELDHRPPKKWYVVEAKDGSCNFLQILEDWVPEESLLVPENILEDMGWNAPIKVLWVCDEAENFLINALETDFPGEAGEIATSALRGIIEKCLKFPLPGRPALT